MELVDLGKSDTMSTTTMSTTPLSTSREDDRSSFLVARPCAFVAQTAGRDRT
jgi:hypothetical protein